MKISEAVDALRVMRSRGEAKQAIQTMTGPVLKAVMANVKLDPANYHDRPSAENALLDELFLAELEFDLEPSWMREGAPAGKVVETEKNRPAAGTKPVNEGEFVSAWGDAIDEAVNDLPGIVQGPIQFALGRISPQEAKRSLKWAAVAYITAMLFQLDRDVPASDPTAAAKPKVEKKGRPLF